MRNEEERAADALAAECPRRIAKSLHHCGLYIHLAHPDTGRVCCYEAACGIPDDFLPTARQEALWAAQERLEGG